MTDPGRDEVRVAGDRLLRTDGAGARALVLLGRHDAGVRAKVDEVTARWQAASPPIVVVGRPADLLAPGRIIDAMASGLPGIPASSFVERVARTVAEHPLLLVLVDAHWADVDVLEGLAAALDVELGRAPLSLLVGGAPTSALTAWAERLTVEGRAEVVPVAPLSDDEVLAVLADHAGPGAADALGAVVVEVSGGWRVPVEEIARRLAAPGSHPGEVDDVLVAVAALGEPARRSLVEQVVDSHASAIDRLVGAFTCPSVYAPLGIGAPVPQPSGALPAGGSARFDVRFDIPADATTGIVALGIVQYPPGVHDLNPANDVSAPFFQPFDPRADVGVTVDNGRTTFEAGVPTTYDVVVANHGPDDVTDLEVAGAPDVPGATWTCVAGSGAACAASGSGKLTDTADIPAGSHVTHAVTLTPPAGVDFQYAVGTQLAVVGGQVQVEMPDGSTAILEVAFSTYDADPRNNLATDYDHTPAGEGQADVGITIDNGQDFVGASETITYTVVVANDGPAATNGDFGAAFLPMVPGSITWSCTPAGGATCTPSGIGVPNNPNDPAFGEGVGDSPSLPPGSTATYTVTGTIDGRRGQFTTINAAFNRQGGAPLAGNRMNDNVRDSDPIVPTVDLAATITDGVAVIAPGAPTTYTVVVTNAGPDTATSVSIVQAVPAELTGVTWTCTATGTATCSAAGTGPIVQHGVSIAPGASLTYTVTGVVSPSATGSLTTSVSVDTPTPDLPSFPGVLDPAPGNDSASDTDFVGRAVPLTVTVTPSALRVDEGQAATVTVRFSPATTIPTTVTWTAVDGIDVIKFRALGAQTPVADYVAGPRTLEVPPGTTTATISVPTNLDGRDEGDESFRIQLTGSTTPLVTIGSAQTSTVTIRQHRAGASIPPPPFPPIVRPGSP